MERRIGEQRPKSPRKQPPASVFDLFRKADWEALAADFDLTDEELEVLKLTIRKLPRKTMASELGIPIGTVHRHCYSLHQKLAEHTEVGLMDKAVCWWLRRHWTG